jgi:hypothetical protein
LQFTVARLWKVACKDHSDMPREDAAYEVLNQKLQAVDPEEKSDSIVKNQQYNVLLKGKQKGSCF